MLRFQFVIYSVLLFALSCTNKEGEERSDTEATLSEHIVEHHENGQPKKSFRYAGSDSLNREEVEFHETGEVMTVGKLIAGERHGEWKSFHPGGQPWSVHYYKQGKQEGLYRVWWHTGIPRIHGQFKEGVKIGEWLFFTETGDTARVINYDDLSTTPLPPP